MINLGQEVLQKIEHLLTEIDLSEKENRKRRQKSSTKHPQSHYTEYDDENPHKHEHTNDKQNRLQGCSNRIQELYLKHFSKQQKIQQKNSQRLNNEIKKNKSFKVQNKHSQFLNERTDRKPLYQRSEEQVIKRQNSIQKIKRALPLTKDELEEIEYQRILQQKEDIFRKYSREEFEQKMASMELRHLRHKHKVQQQKISRFNQKCKDFQETPHISRSSQKIWEKKKLKKNLSKNVFDRFEQYEFEKKSQWEDYVKCRREEETPFAPKISQASRVLAERSKLRSKSKKDLLGSSRTETFRGSISRSCSCNCLSSKIETENPSDRKSLTRLSKNTHNKSTTTVYTSRLASSRKLSASKVKHWY